MTRHSSNQSMEYDDRELSKIVQQLKADRSAYRSGNNSSH